MPAPAIDFGDYLGLTFDKENTLNKSNTCQTKFLPFADSPLYNVEIVAAHKLTSGEDVKDVYDLALSTKDIDYEFKPGDTVGIIPCNCKFEVDLLLNRLNLSTVADVFYSLNVIPNTTKKKAMIPLHIPSTGTLHDVFLKHVDIRSVPKKAFLRSLIRYTTEQEEIEMLQNICSPSGSQLYNGFINTNNSLLKLLGALPSCYPPVERLLENLPPLLPRAYSISSSRLTSNEELHVTFSVIKINKSTKGVCTGWLESLTDAFNNSKQTNDLATLLHRLHIESINTVHVPLYFRKSNDFHLPATPTTPIIMIGPGTGLAPFMSFLEHRYLQPAVKFGTSWLFYGCRYSNRDFLFKNQLYEYLGNGTLTKLSVCFSREANKTCYVQDLITEHKEDLMDWIMHQNATIYVCGDAKNMMKDIRNAIVSCLADVEGLSSTLAENYVKEMEKTKRYVIDNWL